MLLHTIDFIIIIAFFVLSLLIGLYASKQAGKSSADFFLSGRSMPWWLLGTSMVATTFSCDTPNLVTDIVRQHGVAGNWVWWAFLLTGMLTVFVFAKLWSRSRVMTDLEFYELRYSGKIAAFLRGFRAIYLGALFNILIMASVTLALIKIGAVMLDWSALKTVTIAAIITVIYSTFGGLRGIILTDFFQFIISMIGAIGAAIIVVRMPEIGGLHGLMSNSALEGKLDLIPEISVDNWDAVLGLLILPLLIQWWSVWYPGAEPGGGGYIAQRILSAKSEKEAVKATLFFNVVHYALRPWPWILVGLASLIVFPDLDSLAKHFPNIDPSLIKHDLAYPAMLSFLPAGFIGLVVAALIAAYMSTISTHLNWGSSYLVNDFFKRFVKKDADEKELVLMGRIFTVGLMVLAVILALMLRNALQAFNIILQIGAGTGLLYILRWFWWRINATTELAAMIISFFVAVFISIVYPEYIAKWFDLPELSAAKQLIFGVGVTTIGWMIVAFVSEPTSKEKLKSFYKQVRPGGPGWRHIEEELLQEGEMKEKEVWDVPEAIKAMIYSSIGVYAALFSFAYFLYANYSMGIIFVVVSVIAFYLLSRKWRNLSFK